MWSQGASVVQFDLPERASSYLSKDDHRIDGDETKCILQAALYSHKFLKKIQFEAEGGMSF